jgi:hypothetical protein
MTGNGIHMHFKKWYKKNYPSLIDNLHCDYISTNNKSHNSSPILEPLYQCRIETLQLLQPPKKCKNK